MKKSLNLFLFSLFFLPVNIFATDINFSSDKNSGSTDDVFQLRLSIDGQVDGGQVGIEGLENFQIMGQRSSSQIQIINGKTTSVQEQVLSIKPKKSGNFSLTALAKENGEIIKSPSLKFEIKKSLIQETKEKLLQKNTLQNLDTKNNLEENKSEIQNLKNTKTENLKTPEIKNFPKIEHVSAFNKIFWFEFLGICLGIFGMFWGVFKILEKKKKA